MGPMTSASGASLSAVILLLFGLLLVWRLMLPKASKRLDGALFAMSAMLFWVLCQVIVVHAPGPDRPQGPEFTTAQPAR